MSPILAGLTIFGLIAIAATALYAALYGDYRSMEQQVEGLTAKLHLASGNNPENERSPVKFARALLRITIQRLPKRAPKHFEGTPLSHLMVHAGYRSRTAIHVYRAARLIAAAVLAITLIVVGGATSQGLGMILAFAFAGALVGAMIPQAWISRKARIRKAAIARQLSDVLDLIIVCVETGLGLHEAIATVGRKTERNGQEIGFELTTVSREIGSGAPLGLALRHFAERTGVEDIKPLAATLTQSELLGSRIAPALRASSDALRAKRRLKAEEAAQKATVKILLPLVMFVLPAMLLVVVGPPLIHVVRTLGG